VGYRYIEGFTATYLISYGDTLFRVPQPQAFFISQKRKKVPIPFHQSDLYPSPSFIKNYAL